MIKEFKSAIVKMLFGDVIKDEIQKSSKQIISYTSGYTMAQGIVPDIDFEIFNQMYEQTSWVRAVVEVICKAVVSRGYVLAPLTHDADQGEAEKLREFFENCNPNMTISEILYDQTRDVFVYGNAFLEVVYGLDGKPNEIWPLDATTMRVKADVHGTRLGYVQIPRFATAGTENQIGIVPFDVNEVIHFKLATRGSTLYGLSPLASLILPVTVDKYAQIYNRAFFVNGAKIRGAFIMKDATPEQVERNREYLAARAKNPDLAHSDLVMEGEIEFKQIGVNQKDMEFLELREFTRNEILAVYGVPPSKVSIIDTGNIGSGTGEHQSQTFYEETILPFQIRLAEKITKQVIREGFGIRDWAFQFNKRAIDEKDQAEIFNLYIQNGVFTPEEVRRMVAPRMHGIQKDGLDGNEFIKGSSAAKKAGPLGRGAALANHRKALLALENRFAAALSKLYRSMRSAVVEKLRTMRRESLAPAKSGISKAGGLDLLLELINADGIARVIKSFTLQASQAGLKFGASQPQSGEGSEEPSPELEDWVNQNALTLAAGISEGLKDNLRAAVARGLAANETIPQISDRLERELDAVKTVDVAPITDEAGNVLRSGGTRNISAETSAKAIARTETNRAYNAGNLDALKQGQVERVQWLLAPDACPQCLEAADAGAGETLGKVMGIGDAPDELPVHPNCRCTFISVMEGAQ
ncbi:MAG: phage portal protein [Elusimicrobiota bacterium]